MTPLSFRGAVASLGRYGLELDLSKLSQEELEEISRQIRFYRQYEQVIHGVTCTVWSRCPAGSGRLMRLFRRTEKPCWCLTSA